MRDAPVESITKFRQQVAFDRLSTPLRRIAWWAVFNVCGRARTRWLWTFG